MIMENVRLPKVRRKILLKIMLVQIVAVVLLAVVITTAFVGSEKYVFAFEKEPLQQVQGRIIKDENLEEVIRNEINRPEGELTPEDLSGITFLIAIDKQIKELDGLEYAVNLESLDIMRNRIEDITPLKHLENLSYLNFSFNQVAHISPLLELKSLRSVNVLGNPLDSQAEEILQRLDERGVQLFAQSTTFHPEIPASYDLALAAVLLAVVIIYLRKRVEITPERYKRKGIDLSVAVFVFSLALIMLNWEQPVTMVQTLIGFLSPSLFIFALMVFLFYGWYYLIISVVIKYLSSNFELLSKSRRTLAYCFSFLGIVVSLAYYHLIWQTKPNIIGVMHTVPAVAPWLQAFLVLVPLALFALGGFALIHYYYGVPKRAAIILGALLSFLSPVWQHFPFDRLF